MNVLRLFMFSSSLISQACMSLRQRLLCTSWVIKTLFLIWWPPVGGVSFMQFHTHTHTVCLSVLWYYTWRKPSTWNCTCEHAQRPWHKLSVPMQLYTCHVPHKMKSGRKRSAAVSTCVYFAADHISTLRSNREHKNVRKSSGDIIDHNGGRMLVWIFQGRKCVSSKLLYVWAINTY